jgi:hypothetical protein
MLELLILLMSLLIGCTTIVLWVMALVSIIKSDFTGNNKIIWLLIIFFLPFLGMILYYFIGRNQRIPMNNHGRNTIKM